MVVYSTLRIHKTTKENITHYVQLLFGQEALDSPLAADLIGLPDDEPVEFSALPILMPHLSDLEELAELSYINNNGNHPFNSVYFLVMDTEPESRLLIAKTLRTGYANGSIQPPSKNLFHQGAFKISSGLHHDIRNYMVTMDLPPESLQKEAQQLGITNLDTAKKAFDDTKERLEQRFAIS